MATELQSAITGLDALEIELPNPPSRLLRVWNAVWPKVAAIAIVLFGWQAVVWSNWKPEYALPGPNTVLPRFWQDVESGALWKAMWITTQRAVVGYAAALAIGCLVGVIVARRPIARQAVGSLITGLQTMPSIAWFPAAMLVFGINEGAIFFVVVLGAAPAIANGLISGIDQIQPVLLKAGRVLGARGVALWRHVILPAAFPGFVGGLKQGWAFAWRSLMAGEILVIIGNKAGLGAKLTITREFNDGVGMYAYMVAILIVGIVIDAVFFGRIESFVRRRWGLAD